jgi:eukaryotic-like serine/threonine-protein kinase
MEYVAGQSIDVYADAQRLIVKARLALFLQVLDAVGYAHQQLVLHRDLKAGNVLVDEKSQVRLLDFGVARLLPRQPTEAAADRGGAVASELTERAGAAFTLGHAAPEQVSHGALSTATDVYALGVMLYRLLTGLSPYQPPRDTRGALEEAVLLATPAAASSRTFDADALVARQTTTAALRKSLGDNLDVILAKALKKNPQERYATVAAFADDLRRHLAQQPISARADSGWYRTRLFVARNRVAVMASTLAAVALVGTAGVAVWQARVSARNAALATKEAARASTAQKFFAGLLAKADPELNKQISVVDRQIIDQTLSNAERDFADAPETLALVLKQLGEIYDRLGMPAKHLEVQRKRVALLGSMPDATADEAVDANLALSFALSQSQASQERAQSLPKLMSALDMAVLRKASHNLHVRALCMIADRTLAQSKYREADALARKAVDLAERSLPKPHPELAMAYDQLGATATRMGEFKVARESFAKAMAVGAMAPTRSKLAQINSQLNLANTEYFAGDYIAAKREALSALAFAREHLGEMEDTLTALRVRATLASERAGQLDEAAQLARSLFVSDLAADDSFRVARAHYVAGVVGMSRGELAHAEHSFESAQLGLEVSPRWQRQLIVQQGTLMLKQNKPEAAGSALTSLVNRVRVEVGTESEDFSAAVEQLGVAFARTNQTRFAQRDFEAACAWRRRIFNSNHPLRVRCESYLVLISDQLTVSEKRQQLNRQLNLLTTDRGDRLALVTSLQVAAAWVGKNSSGERHFQDFPLLD